MNNCLIITHDFSPTWHAGVARIHYFVNHLINSKSWNIKVLSADDSYTYQVFNKIEPIQNIPGTIEIIKTKSLEPKSKKIQEKVFGTRKKSLFENIVFFILKHFFEPLLIPDRSCLWIPYALKAGCLIMKENKIDIIFSTGPPFTNHLIAKFLSSLFKIKLALDFRDDWVGNPFYNKGLIRRCLNRILEKWVVKGETIIITTTEESKHSFINKYNFSIHERVSVITNGFDDDFYNKVTLAKKELQRNRDEKIVFLYAGSLTPTRTPVFFFKAIKSLLDKNIFNINDIRINIIGYYPIVHTTLAAELQLESCVNFIEPIDQNKLIEHYVSCHVLLLFQRSSEGGKTAIPGKFYEYLCIEKPIFLMSDGGATDNILLKLNAGYLVKYDDIPSIETTLLKLINAVKEKKPLNVCSPRELIKYSRTSLNNSLLNIINNFQ
jgi:glycosyltransferase involved in cell wall biosynthesis